MFFHTTLSYLLPQWCLGCNREGSLVFEKCVTAFPTQLSQITHAELFDGVWYLTPYANLLTQKVVQTCKYRYIEELGALMGTLLAYGWKNSNIVAPIDVIVPIPLHRRRFIERGFNQSSVIAREVGMRISVHMHNKILKRTRATKRQVDCTIEERSKNVFNAFQVFSTPPKSVLIVDDVYTTGSTARETARVLRDAGVKQLYCLSFAHG